MKWSRTRFGLLTVTTLLFCAIWQGAAQAAAPAIASLGQVRDGLYRPTRLAIDDEANLFIADPRGRTVQKWDMYGTQLAVFSGLPVAGALAVTPDGARLYVSGQSVVNILDAQTGTVLGALGQGEGEFGHAFDLDLDAAGNVYVAEGENLTIRVYDAQGTFKYAFAGRGKTGALLNSMSAMVVHPQRQEVYVADSSFPDPYFPRVVVYSLSGSYLRSMDSRTAFGKAMYFFGAIAFDDAGRGYFFDGSLSRLSVLDLPATYRLYTGVEGDAPGQLLAPRDAVYDRRNKRLIVLNADSRLEYFGIDGGSNPVNLNLPPGLPVPLSPAAGSEVASPTPTLSFQNAVDPDGDRLTYSLRLQQGGQTVAEYGGIAEGAGPTSFTLPQPLTEDATYSWSLQAFDGKLTSGWSAPQSFRVNAVQEPPSVPVALAPTGGAEVASATPALTFGNASDPDSAVITYNLRLLNGRGEIVAESTGLAEGAGQTSFQVAQPLIENASYAWSVQATDGLLASAWSAPQSFRVNAIAEPPAVPVALTPAAGSILATATPVFTFGGLSDPDGDPVTCTVRLQQDGQTVAEYGGIGAGQGESAFALTEPLTENARYTWSVQATDGQLVSAWSLPQAFIVNAVQDPPSAPALLAPASGEAIDGTGELRWAQASDPDPGATLRYRLQISDAPEFATVLIDEDLSDTQLVLGECAGYPELAEGSTHYWRVLAIDNDGLVSEGGTAGIFVLDTTVLAITANVPGTRIYLGGNHAYPGRPLGEGPLTLRDLPPGSYRIVAERAGMEIWLTQVDLAARQNAAVQARLLPALAPASNALIPLSADGQKIAAGGSAAPFVVDLDGDRILDLLLADASGAVHLYRGLSGEERQPLYAAAENLGQFLPGAVPFIADWNNDGRPDLLLGAQDGTVSLHLDSAASGLPRYGAGTHLAVVGVPIQVGGSAAPAVLDYDEDGDKDLLVGDAGGALWLFANGGSDEEPVLAAPRPIATVAAPASYFFSDWNADGRRDLLSADGSLLQVAYRNADGTFAAAQGALDLTLPGSKKKGASETLRLFACDHDGVKGKDVFAGTADGQVYLALANGQDLLPAFQEAVLAKIGQLEALAEADAPLAGKLAALRAAAEAGDLKEVKKQTGQLLAAVEAEIAPALEELFALIQ